MSSQTYENREVVTQYLLFHYGTGFQQFPHIDGPRNALHFPERCVTECLAHDLLPGNDRALDLGCSVGRASFELSRHFREVVAVDLSRAFIEVARVMQQRAEMVCRIPVEASLTQEVTLRLGADLPRERVNFMVGDALNPGSEWGTFDCVLAANLLDRVSDPVRLLHVLTSLTRSGGQLLLISPYTWLEEFTPSSAWPTESTFDFLKHHLEPHFSLHRKKDLPFLIREHARKYQLSYAESTVWIRH